jgi:hypothetical protein
MMTGTYINGTQISQQHDYNGKNGTQISKEHNEEQWHNGTQISMKHVDQ